MSSGPPTRNFYSEGRILRLGNWGWDWVIFVFVLVSECKDCVRAHVHTCSQEDGLRSGDKGGRDNIEREEKREGRRERGRWGTVDTRAGLELELIVFVCVSQ